MRNARFASVCACTVPVRLTVPPSVRFSIVIVRTGRISGAGGASAGLHAASTIAIAHAMNCDKPDDARRRSSEPAHRTFCMRCFGTSGRLVALWRWLALLRFRMHLLDDGGQRFL